MREGARFCALLRTRTDIRNKRAGRSEIRLRMWFSSLMNKQSGAMAKAIAPLWRSAKEFARGARLCALLRARTDIRIVQTRKGEVRLRMWFSSLMNKQSGAMAKAIAPLWRSAREFARGRKALRVAPSPNRHPHRADKERRSPPADVVLVPHEQAKRSHGKSHSSALALREGLEPPTLRSEGECSIQLN